MNCIRKIVPPLLIALLHSAIAYASITDTIHSIQEIEVIASRLEQYIIGSSVQEIDSLTLNNYPSQSLAEVLSHQSLASVKTYGPGGVAGISIRGGGSHHASVVWNGINIQSPMLGEVNFSTLPVSFIDKAYIQYGGATTLFGSGATTGSIHLSDELHLNKGFQADVSSYIGINHNYIDSNSYDISDFVQSAKLSYSNRRWASSLKFFFQDNRNDFDFLNSEKSEKPYEKLDHGSYNQYGFSQSNKFLLGKKSVIGTDIWWLNLYKEIPSQMSDYENGITDQTDRNLMYSFYYKYLGNKIRIKIQSGGFYNQVLYEDPRRDPRITNNRSFSSINISEFTYDLFSNLQLGFICEYKSERGLSGFYNDWEIRKIISPVFSVLYKSSNLNAVVNVRKENVDGKFIPFVFSAGLDFLIINGLSLKGHLSKNYSLPTLNNLYWEFDGFATGNPNLLPESGWSFETGMHYSLEKERLHFNTGLVLFQNNIANWIKWLVDTNNIYKPQNVLEGITRGIELDVSVSSKFNSIQILLNARYGYTHAEALKSGTTDIQPGRQMFYIPKHKTCTSIAVKYKKYFAEYSQNFVGKRTFDNLGGSLDAYTIGNFMQQFTIPIEEEMRLVIYMKINNLWGTRYQMQKSYAQPLRQYTIGIKFLFNQ